VLVLILQRQPDGELASGRESVQSQLAPSEKAFKLLQQLGNNGFGFIGRPNWPNQHILVSSFQADSSSCMRISITRIKAGCISSSAWCHATVSVILGGIVTDRNFSGSEESQQGDRVLWIFIR